MVQLGIQKPGMMANTWLVTGRIGAGIIWMMLLLLTSCTRNVSIDQVQKLEKHTSYNEMYQYHYLAIPDSASLSNLISITEKFAARSKRKREWTVYNYYLRNDPTHVYATLMTAKALSTAKDTVAILQFRNENSPLTELIKSLSKELPDQVKSLPDTCIGVWANWANPFMPYTILYQRNNNYYVKGLSGKSTMAVTDSTTASKRIIAQKAERSTYGSPVSLNVYRYELMKYGDLYVTNDLNGIAYMSGIYNFICDCKTKQKWK